MEEAVVASSNALKLMQSYEKKPAGATKSAKKRKYLTREVIY